MKINRKKINHSYFTICLSEQLKQFLEAAHWDLKRSQSEIVREAIVDYCEKKKLSDETREILEEVR